MRFSWFFLVLIVKCVTADEVDENGNRNNDYNIKVSENRIAAQLFAVIDHYKQDDPVGIPGAPIPDPMPVPDIRKSIGIGTLNMKKVKAFGLSKFRIKHVKLDLKGLQVNAGIQLDVMNVVGSYTMNYFLSRAEGPFKVQLKNVFVTGNATLGVERDGKLRTQDIKMDITFSDMEMDFQNLGFLGSIFQGAVNAAPTLVFDMMKPLMLAEAYSKLRAEIDTNIKKMTADHSFSNSILPLDMAIAEARKLVRSKGYDPFRIPAYNRTEGLFSMETSNTWVVGLSSFYRVGNMTVEMENNTMFMKLQIGTQKLEGFTQWEVGFGNGMITRTGHAQFTLDYIRTTFEISQTLDVRKRPQIRDIQIDLGNIQVRCDGAGTLDYIFEFIVNVLPNFLRYQIMDALENPIKVRIQEKLNEIDVEKAIKENLNNFHKLDVDFPLNFKN